jgi:hypothetical protein
VQHEKIRECKTHTLQEKGFFAATKIVGKDKKLMEKIFIPTTKKSLQVVAISSVAKSFATKFSIIDVHTFANKNICCHF